MFSLEEREAQMDRLEFVRNQLNFLTEDIKDKIKAIADEVAAKVTCTITPFKTHHGNRSVRKKTKQTKNWM